MSYKYGGLEHICNYSSCQYLYTTLHWCHCSILRRTYHNLGYDVVVGPNLVAHLFHIKSNKKITTDQYNNLFKKGNGNMFRRLTLCRLYAYCSNPQFTISMHPTNAAVSTVCLACSIVVIQAAFRSLILKQLNFCKGVSDYDLSMPYIVVAQLIAIIVGTFTILYRWLSLFSRMDLKSIFLFFWSLFFQNDDDDDMKLRHKTLKKGLSLQRLKELIASLNMIVVSIAQLLIVLPSVLLHYNIPGLHKEEELEDFDQLHPKCVIGVSLYIVRKSVNDFIRLSELCNKESLVHLPRILSQRSTSQCFNDGRHTMEIRDRHTMEIRDQGKEIQVCSLSMAVLVKIAQVSIPKDHIGLLLDAFKEAKEIILFIDNVYIQPKTLKDYDKYSYAEAVWTGGDFTHISAFPPDGPDALDHALKIMQSLKGRSAAGNLWPQLGVVVDFINRETYSSVEDLYTSIEQLFVDMLHITLAQLPAAIFKSLSDSSAEEFEDRVQLAMKFLFKTGCLEDIICWWYPSEYNISSFVTDSDPSKKPLTGALEKLEGVVPKRLDKELMNVAEGV